HCYQKRLDFSSWRPCKKDRIREPVSTARSTISIVLKVFFFFCMMLPPSMLSLLSYPQLFARPVSIPEVEVLSNPGMEARDLRQVQTVHKEKDCMYLRLRTLIDKLLQCQRTTHNTNDRSIHQVCRSITFSHRTYELSIRYDTLARCDGM